jgi:Polyketide cyclase / dehydrase and lipid transport
MFGRRVAEPLREWTVRRSVDIDAPVARVWSFIEDPANIRVLQPEAVSACWLPHLPGSEGIRVGVGAVQATLRRSAQGLAGFLIEVVEHEPGRRAVTKQLPTELPDESNGPPPVHLTETRVDPLEGGRTRLTHSTHWLAPPGSVLDRDLVVGETPALEAFWDAVNARVRAALETPGLPS